MMLPVDIPKAKNTKSDKGANVKLNIIILCLLLVIYFSCQVHAVMPQELGRKDSKGRFIIPRVKVDTKFANPDWSDEWEDEFKDRADAIVKHSLTWGKIRGNTYFENEKRRARSRAYPDGHGQSLSYRNGFHYSSGTAKHVSDCWDTHKALQIDLLTI